MQNPVILENTEQFEIAFIIFFFKNMCNVTKKKYNNHVTLLKIKKYDCII